jgi:hypothetical protein
MAKQKKRRNKRYHGADARLTTPSVMRVSAEERSAFKEWWLVYGRLVRFSGIVIGIIVLVVFCLIGIIGLFHR